MAGVALHVCPVDTSDGTRRIPEPKAVKCGNCGRGWCERCDPAPSALCHYCNGTGSTSAPIPPRQLRWLFR